MRIYNRKDFLNLPPDTIFCKGTEWCFENLCRKEESIENDFFYQELCDIDCTNSEDRDEKFEDALKNATSLEINRCNSRDGMFDDDAVFLVFEKKDLLYLYEVIIKCVVKSVLTNEIQD